MKKILMATLEYPPKIGGVAVYVEKLALDLSEFFEVTVLTEKISKTESVREKNPRVIEKKLTFPRPFFPRSLRSVLAMWSLARRQKFNLTIVHHFLPLGYGALFLRLFFKIPYIVFSHGTDVIAAYERPFKRKLASFVMSRASLIVVNSRSLETRLLDRFPSAEGKTKVVYPEPDEIFFAQSNLEKIKSLRRKLALEGKRVGISVGRLVDGKGFPHLLRAVAELAKKIPNLAWLIVGDGDKRDLILKMIEDYKLQNTVRFLGSVPNRELPDYYRLSEVFVLLTHPDDGREEGLGLVFVEAGACGLPSVAGRSGGVEEAVIDGETGFVVDVYQFDKVVQLMEKLFFDQELARGFGRSAAERANKVFRIKQGVKAITDFTSSSGL